MLSQCFKYLSFHSKKILIFKITFANLRSMYKFNCKLFIGVKFQRFEICENNVNLKNRGNYVYKNNYL